MPVFKDAFSTTLFGGYTPIKHVISALENYVDKYRLNNHVDKFIPLLENRKTGKMIQSISLYGDDPDQRGIPAFSFPVTIEKDNSVYIVADYRAFYSVKSNAAGTNMVEIKPTSNAASKLLRDLHVSTALTAAGKSMKMLSTYGGNIFSSWLTTSTGRNYGLDYRDQAMLKMVASLYFNSLYVPEVNFKGKQEAEPLLYGVLLGGGVDPMLRDELVEYIQANEIELKGISDYVALSKKLVNNITYKNEFSTGVLVSLIKNSFYGPNAVELLTCCLELPDYFIVLLHTVLEDRTFKSSPIRVIADSFGKAKNTETFQEGYRALMNSLSQD